MLVSILLPTYNAASTLAATLDSVYAQDWPHWEVIIVDDASSDDTVALANAAAQMRPLQVRVLVNERNAGSGYTRNRALGAAQGTWVASLDADDLWQPHKLRSQVALLTAHPQAALVWGPGYFADAAGHPTRLQAVPLPPEPTCLPPPQLVELMLDGICPFTSSVMVRRDAALAVGGYEELRRGQDMTFLYKLATAHATLYDPEPLCLYRIHERSSTRWCEQNLVYAQRDDAYYRWLAGYLAATPPVAHLAPRADAIVAQHQHYVAVEQAVASLAAEEVALLHELVASEADLRPASGYAAIQQLCDADGRMPPATATLLLQVIQARKVQA
jgi:glycosyltransferase involved in cell wall biosynthesis